MREKLTLPSFGHSESALFSLFSDVTATALCGNTKQSAQVSITTASLRIGDINYRITTMQFGQSWTADTIEKISDSTGLAISSIERVAALSPVNVVAKENKVLQILWC